MGSPAQQAWTGTPAFELFRRGLNAQSIIRFRGLNAYTSISSLGPDWAQDILNVIVSGSGGLSKLRLPIAKSIPIAGKNSGPNSFWDFQQANGLRQTLAVFGSSIYYYSNDLSVVTLIENNVLNSGAWSFATANNILFGANGARMQKWTGSNWWKWGIDAPTKAPGINIAVANASATRAANVVTVTLPSGSPMPGAGDFITLAAFSDATFNGVFLVQSSTPGSWQFTVNQTAANAGPVTGVVDLSGEVFNQPIIAITRNTGLVTATVASAARVQVGDYVFVAGVGDASFDNDGTSGSPPFQVTAVTPTTLSWEQDGADSVSSGGTIFYGLLPQTGLTWAYSYANSKTGHVSNISPVSAVSGTSSGTNGKRFDLTPIPSSDPQVDSYWWFRTLDGGGDYYFVGITTVASPILLDSTPDLFLDQSKRGPLINNAPVIGKYVAVGQGRVIVFNLVGAPQDVEYSGYDQIFIGRPEESFPPNNRLRLSIGAEMIAGGGIMQAGVVAFSQTGRMYMLRGQLEDITLAVPVNFSAFLEELPWTLGCFSHFTVQTTPYGMVWLAGDKTLQLFDGRNEPVDISVGVYPLLRQITPGTEGQCVAAYFNWLERDWYVLLAAVNGSLYPNRIFFFAFNKVLSADPTQANTLIESIELFISDLPATIAGASPWIGLITTSDLQRMLCIASQGLIQQLPVSSDTVNGLNRDPSIIPPTSGKLNAFWKGGYWGGEAPQRSRIWRWARLLSDVDPSAFHMTINIVDYQKKTFLNPEIIGPKMFKIGQTKMGINKKGCRMAVEIDFPPADLSANVVELQVAQIATADR